MASNEILLVTGGNTGLGFETVKSLCQSEKAYTILLGGRSLEKANAAVENVRVDFPQSASTVKAIQVDIEDDDSISRAYEQVDSEYGRLDILINNAGVQVDQQVLGGKMTMRQAWNKSWDVNTTGTQLMTYTFVPLLLQSANPRIIFIASGTSTLAEQEKETLWVDRPAQKGWPKQPMEMGPGAYRSSKTGMNMMMREWARILKADGVKVWAVSPGMLATGLGGNPELLKKMGALDPQVGADIIRDVVEGGRDHEIGKVIRKDNVQPW
ncbi:hypothetical protein EDD36DRAFT_137141 [Exophiala viscosa]|uniref:Short chain dehydrogenase n=1 Tax=Exophiala viscosa TaxID=2486360 RepID=A0AAN6E3Z4_9EURO|nr:hypothetical protein EDD36DRAFT_137141 [Exophiala viscosa]